MEIVNSLMTFDRKNKKISPYKISHNYLTYFYSNLFKK